MRHKQAPTNPAVPIGSLLRKPINERILKLNDAGVLSQIHAIWFGAQY